MEKKSSPNHNSPMLILNPKFLDVPLWHVAIPMIVFESDSSIYDPFFDIFFYENKAQLNRHNCHYESDNQYLNNLSVLYNNFCYLLTHITQKHQFGDKANKLFPIRC